MQTLRSITLDILTNHRRKIVLRIKQGFIWKRKQQKLLLNVYESYFVVYIILRILIINLRTSTTKSK